MAGTQTNRDIICINHNPSTSCLHAWCDWWVPWDCLDAPPNPWTTETYLDSMRTFSHAMADAGNVLLLTMLPCSTTCLYTGWPSGVSCWDLSFPAGCVSLSLSSPPLQQLLSSPPSDRTWTWHRRPSLERMLLPSQEQSLLVYAWEPLPTDLVLDMPWYASPPTAGSPLRPQQFMVILASS